MSKRKVFLTILITSAMCGWYFFSHRHSHSLATPEATYVDVAKVTLGSIPIEARAIGTLVAPKNVQISPEETGQVAKVFFKDGGIFVKQGTPLIQLDDATYRAKLDSDKANLLYSQTDYDRKVLLGKQGAISRQAIDQARADLATRKAAVEESQVNLNRMLLVAPFDGVLGKINVSPGDYVTAGQKVVSITDIQHLRVEYAVSEKYLPQLKLGQKIKITTSTYPGKEFDGTVTFISPTIDMDDRTIALYADVSNDKQLLASGLFMNVTQELGMQNQAVIVPATCLVPTIGGEQVFKLVNHKAVAVPVVLGQRLKDAVQIASGVAPGDEVVVAGQQKLKDGMPIQVNQPG